MISASPRRLLVFKSVVDLGGFNLAATKLGIAQPSVGAHIKALEAQVGQPLFHRMRGSKPKLTKAGEAVYAYAIEVLRKSEETSQALDGLRQDAAREITIGVHRDIAAHFLPRRLKIFADRHSEVRVVTRIGTIDEVVELARSGTADLGLFLADGEVADLRSVIVAHEPLALVVSPQHELASHVLVTPETVCRFPFITGLRTSRFFQLVRTALESVGITQYEIPMELQESATVKEMVRHGAGIACLPRCTVTSELAAGALIALRLSTHLPDLQLRCGYRVPLSGPARQFMRALGKN
jgi:DNA-binding transcriptional LysR family regulator